MNGCIRDSFGVITGYDRGKGQIAAELRQMFQDGQRRLRLPVFFSSSPTTPPVMLKVGPDGISVQDRQNLSALIKMITDIGYQEVLVGAFPFGSNWAASWNEWQEDRYRENWLVITQLRQLMDASGLLYKLDLQNEGIPFSFQLMLKAYTHRLWQDYVHSYGPTKTVGFSGQPKVGRIQEIPGVYGGILPEAFDFHLGANADHDLREIDATLRSLNLGNTPIIIGEALYNDAEEASELATAARIIPRRILYLTQWPQTRIPMCPQVSVIPTQFDAYRRHGF
jgi:hypothetical protein